MILLDLGPKIYFYIYWPKNVFFKEIDKLFPKMAIKNILGQVNACFCHNKVEILTIFISFYFVKLQPIHQHFNVRMTVLDAHYKTVFKVPFQVALEKSYGQ